MGRQKQSQNIDSSIRSIEEIVKNQCSFSEQEKKILLTELNDLRELRSRKGKTNEQILAKIAIILALLARYFTEGEMNIQDL